MLKDEERIAEVKRRIAKKEQQQRLRRRRIVSAVCIAACFAVIVGVSFAMPGIIGRIEPSTSSGFETAATILGKAAVKAGQQEIYLFSIFQIPNTTHAKAQQGNSELKKVTDQLHPHCPPFVSPSAPLCSADGCENTE